MKLVVNSGVRASMDRMLNLARQADACTRIMANRSSGFSAESDAGFERERLKEKIVAEAYRILSHATRGRLYPNMTEGVYYDRYEVQRRMAMPDCEVQP